MLFLKNYCGRMGCESSKDRPSSVGWGVNCRGLQSQVLSYEKDLLFGVVLALLNTEMRLY